MTEKKSRVTKYADLRRKIENMSYFPISDEKDRLQVNYTPDREKIVIPTKSNGNVVKHNTLTIPLDELLAESLKGQPAKAAANTQELKKLDEPKLQPKHKKTLSSIFGHDSVSHKKRRFLFRKEVWIWVGVATLCIALAVTIVLVVVLTGGKKS